MENTGHILKEPIQKMGVGGRRGTPLAVIVLNSNANDLIRILDNVYIF